MILDNVSLGMAGSVLLFMMMSFFYSTAGFTSIVLIFSVCLAGVVSSNREFSPKIIRDENELSPKSARSHILKSIRRRSFRSRRTVLILLSCAAVIISAARIPELYSQGENGRIWYSAQTLTRKGEYDRAIEKYRLAYPGLRWNGRFLHEFGKTLLISGKDIEAVAVLEQGKKLWPSPYLLEELSVAYEQTGNVGEAIKNAAVASDILPWRLTSKMMLADLYYRVDDFTRASEYAHLVVDTPMKIETEMGKALKARAFRLIQDLKAPWTERIARREKAISLITDSCQLDVRQALNDAGANEMQLVEAIHSLETGQRFALVFLLVNMPRRDLKSLSSDFLVENVTYAHKTRSSHPCNTHVPDDVFLNYVLPYAHLNEYRDNWRALFFKRFIGVAEKGLTAEETALYLQKLVIESSVLQFRDRDFGEEIFSPFKTMGKGFASCEGGAILVADACRAVGIPSRLVFLPEWVPEMQARGGGHVWLEVYDQGQWHSITAYDFWDPDWHIKYVQKTDPSKPQHRVYAVSFQRTDLHYRFGPDVSVIDVTDRYAPEYRFQ
jgi:tetratricopeptide (TPR) repeat protein